ncbi:MAG: peptide-methionine (R)-S-oxide reductase [bacterium]|nr:peptide-methionine (R)-S-oxide reductase [bacterium]
MDERQFKEKLNPEQYRIMRQKGTEMPYISKYWDHTQSGIYFCAACGNKLFSSLAKFNSGEGWPTFRNPTSEKDIEVGTDAEVRCHKCKSHLGEVVDEGGNRYYRANSVCLDFQPVGIEFEEDKEDDASKKGEDEEGSGKHRRAQSPKWKMASFVAGGVAVGALVGASFGVLFCQTSEVNFESENVALSPVELSQPTSIVTSQPTIAESVVPPQPRAAPTTSTSAATSAETTPESPAIPPPPRDTTTATSTGSEATSGGVQLLDAGMDADQTRDATPVGGGTVSGG